mmetsp:Transcript_37791/g.121263  ORF Transcript_37791/g.121263 Transcript_37791/m.121263 type:complete len:299 (-) Transcript_37791:923-1819(-)
MRPWGRPWRRGWQGGVRGRRWPALEGGRAVVRGEPAVWAAAVGVSSAPFNRGVFVSGFFLVGGREEGRRPRQGREGRRRERRRRGAVVVGAAVGGLMSPGWLRVFFLVFFRLGDVGVAVGEVALLAEGTVAVGDEVLAELCFSEVGLPLEAAVVFVEGRPIGFDEGAPGYRRRRRGRGLLLFKRKRGGFVLGKGPRRRAPDLGGRVREGAVGAEAARQAQGDGPAHARLRELGVVRRRVGAPRSSVRRRRRAVRVRRTALPLRPTRLAPEVAALGGRRVCRRGLGFFNGGVIVLLSLG